MKANGYRPRAKHLRSVWFSCSRFTVRLRVDAEERIWDAAPVCRTFIGQTLEHLGRWVVSKGWGMVRQKYLDEVRK